MAQKEIEIRKVATDNEILSKFLAEKYKKVSIKSQTDYYFDDSRNSFLNDQPIKKWLRIRKSDNKASINLKDWHIENGKSANYCDEFESEIQDAEAVKGLLLNLGYTLLVEVSKVRTHYKFEDISILVDEIKDLGAFVELEVVGNTADPKETLAMLENLATEIKLSSSEEISKGYPWLLLKKNGTII